MKRIARVLLVFFFILAGIGHFIMPEFYIKMMPPYLPQPYTLVYISGLFEILFGILAIFETTRLPAMFGLIALLVAVFPANINMALHPETFPQFSEWTLWARLPFQILFIVWVVYALSRDKSTG